MRRKRPALSFLALAGLIAVVLVGVEALTQSVASAAVNSRGWINVPAGDALATGTPGIFQQFESVTATGGANGPVTVTMSGGGRAFTIVFGPDAGQLTAKNYEGTTKAGAPRLDVSGNGASCSATFGRYVVDDIAFSGGAVSRLAMSFYQRCDSNSINQPVTNGGVWFNEPGGPINPISATELVPVAQPVRVLDTRYGVGLGRTSPLGQGETVEVPVTGCGGCPPTGLTSAVVMNVTATAGSARGYLTVWPKGGAMPNVSNVNWLPGESRPNLVVVKVSGDGRVNLFNSDGATHVLFDVVGYFAPEGSVSGGRFRPITPARLLDTRLTGNPLVAGVPRALAIPAAGATAAVLNVTVAGSGGGGYVTVYPGNVANPPTASNLNFGPNQVVPNLVVTGVVGGLVNLVAAGADVHLVVDLVGYFDTDTSSGAGRFVPMDPERKLDTRNPGYRALGGNGQQDFGVAGQLSRYPFGVSGVVMNTTVANTSADSYLTVFPTQASGHPFASNLNWKAGEDRPNLVMIGTSNFGFVSMYNAIGNADVILDVAGWFTG